MSQKFERSFRGQSILFLFVAAVSVLVSGCMEFADNKNDGNVYHTYFLGGQSNMVGFGYSDELPATFSGRSPSVRIYQGNFAPDGSYDGGLGIWAPLEPGFGAGFRSDGRKNRLGKRFGPE